MHGIQCFLNHFQSTKNTPSDDFSFQIFICVFLNNISPNEGSNILFGIEILSFVICLAREPSRNHFEELIEKYQEVHGFLEEFPVLFISSRALYLQLLDFLFCLTMLLVRMPCYRHYKNVYQCFRK